MFRPFFHYCFLALAGILPLLSFGQPGQQINPDGYNKFYHDNGQLSSEGSMRNGKPDGYWKTYSKNGKIKSEGNRINFLLDSTWKFYDDEGNLLLEYFYRGGKKNGFKKTYDIKTGRLTSEEYFTNDVKQGITNLYYKGGQLQSKIIFMNGKEEGVAYEYDTLGAIISLIDYKFGFIKRQERINRRDNNGWKQGLWKEFYACQSDCDTKPLIVKRECTYLDDKMNGYLKEYSADGNLINTAKYVNDKLVENVPELSKIDIKTEYYEDAKVKAAGGYRNGVPEGVHREYNPDGKVTASKIYKDGNVVSQGIVDEQGRYQGPWNDFYPNGKLRAKGEYKNGKRVGEWNFFHPNGKMEQIGKYDASGRAQGQWKWYYESGNLLREENYLNDKQDGLSTEYDDSSRVVTKGEYLDGQKEGFWTFEQNGHRDEGNYKSDNRDGTWKHYYLYTNKLRFEGRFINGAPEGKHVYYYPDGKIEAEGKYVAGNKDGDWKYYSPDGFLFLTILFKDGVEVKFDGVKVRPSQEEIEQGELKK